jgi:hypothetical protein
MDETIPIPVTTTRLMIASPLLLHPDDFEVSWIGRPAHS